MALKLQKIAGTTAPPVEDQDVHLIYKIEGSPHEVDIFELSKVLESLGQVLQEGNRVLHPENELALKVSPFEPGSFIMEIAMHLQQNADQGTALFASLLQPEMVKQAKEILENIGLIKKTWDFGANLLELLRKLKNGKPEKIEKAGRGYEYKTQDGSIVPVSAPVHNLYNSGVVNNYIFNVAAPVERSDVSGVKTFLKSMEAATGIEITKSDIPALRAYVEPPVNDRQPEVIENTTTYMLHPKSGNYGEKTGQWTFRIAGTTRTLKAKISDPLFLAKYTDGAIRFYAQDLLKAHVHEKQIVDGSKVKVQNEIIEVVEYRPAHPSQRR